MDTNSFFDILHRVAFHSFAGFLFIAAYLLAYFATKQDKVVRFIALVLTAALFLGNALSLTNHLFSGTFFK